MTFRSEATNLVSGDTNRVDDIFLRDTQSGSTTRLSVDLSGVEGNGYSTYPSISADGRYVTFTSNADNLVSGDTNRYGDIFVRNLARRYHRARRQPVQADAEGEPLGLFSPLNLGRWALIVAFQSLASNLVSDDTNGSEDYFRHDMQTGETIRVSVSSQRSTRK